VDVEVSSDSMEEEDEEEDLVRFEDIMSAASRVADAIEIPRLSCNVSKPSGSENFPFHFIQGFACNASNLSFPLRV